MWKYSTKCEDRCNEYISNSVTESEFSFSCPIVKWPKDRTREKGLGSGYIAKSWPRASTQGAGGERTTQDQPCSGMAGHKRAEEGCLLLCVCLMDKLIIHFIIQNGHNNKGQPSIKFTNIRHLISVERKRERGKEEKVSKISVFLVHSSRNTFKKVCVA